jgi:hypothetical protein
VTDVFTLDRYGRIKDIAMKVGFAFVEFDRPDDAVSSRTSDIDACVCLVCMPSTLEKDPASAPAPCVHALHGPVKRF